MGGIKIEPHLWSITPHSKCISIKPKPWAPTCEIWGALLLWLSLHLGAEMLPCPGSGFGWTGSLSLAGSDRLWPFVFSPLLFQSSFPTGSHSGPWLQQLQESLAQHAPNSFQTHSESLNLLFSICSKWLPCLCLLTHCLEPCPLSRLFPSTSSKMPSHQNCASILLFINRPHLASAVETQGDPDGIFPSEGSGLWFFQGKNSRIRSAPCTAMPLAGLVSCPWLPDKFQHHSQLPASPPPLMSFAGKTLHCCCIHTLHSPKLDTWALSKHVHASLCVWPWHSLFPEETFFYIFFNIIMCMHTHVFSHFTCVWLFATPHTVARRLLSPWDSPGKNTGVGCHALLQGIFLTQNSNLCLLCLLHCRWIL